MSAARTPRRFVRGCACCAAPAAAAAEVPSRRRFLADAALGTVAAAISLPALAQTPAAKAPRIDVHHHYVAPFHRDVLKNDRAGAGLPDWTVEGSLADMDKSGTTTAILSVVQPGVWFGNADQSRKLARDCNEYGARLVRAHAGRFGLFAAIAPPDVEGSLREIAYALDTLKADGIALMTSYQDRYLGDPAFLPVFEELNRRKAVVYVHPNTPDCCRALVKGVPVSTIEYATDSTRTIASLIFGEAGTAFKCPDIRFIWSHSGGTLPFLTGRLVRLAADRKDPRMPEGPIPLLQKYFYEIAQGHTPGQLAALMKLVAVSQVLFGTDYPFRPGTESVEGLSDYRFSDADQRAINYETARRLLPRLTAG